MKAGTPITARQATAAGQFQLTREGLIWVSVTAVLGAVGWFKGLHLVLLLAYMMLALLALNGVLARVRARSVLAVRSHIAPVFAGEAAIIRVTVRNVGKKPATVIVIDRVGKTATSWLVDGLAAGAELICSGRRPFLQRGLYRASPLLVCSSYPFGFLKYQRKLDEGVEVIVLPAAGEGDPEGLRRWVLRRASGEGWTRRVLRRVTGTQADIRGVRAYRPGDNLRWVHWRSSAHCGELMVREYDESPAPELMLVVEPWLPANPGSADRVNLEAALSLVVTILRTWCLGTDGRVTIVVAGTPPVIRSSLPSENSVRAAIVPLADVTGITEFEPLGVASFGRSLRHSAGFVVSSRGDSPLAAALTRTTERAFTAVHAGDRLPWYQAPRPEQS